MAVEVSGDEDALLTLVRDEAGVDFSMSVVRMGSAWSVTISSSDGEFLGGHGQTFRAAWLEAFGVEEKPSLRQSLKVVGGSDHEAPMEASA